MNTILKFWALVYVMIPFLFAEAEKSTIEQDISAIVQVVPASERQKLATYLRKPVSRDEDYRTLSAENTLNLLNTNEVEPISLPLARVMLGYLQDPACPARDHAFSRVLSLHDFHPDTTALIAPVLVQIANTPDDPLGKRAKKFTSETAEQRREADIAGYDESIKRMIIGKWSEIFHPDRPNILVFNKDGTFSSTSWKDVTKTEILVIFRGKWSVDRGFLVYHTEYCSDPFYTIPKEPVRDRVLELGDEIVYQANDGTKVKMRRFKE